MAFIPQNDLSHELIKTVLEEAAHEASLDDEGDVFISGDGIEFPVWVSLTRDRLVKIFTYAEMLDDVEFEDAVVFANDLNQSIMLPAFSILHGSNENFRLWGHCFLPTQFGVDSKTIVSTVRRFSGAFRAGLLKDDVNLFFE